MKSLRVHITVLIVGLSTMAFLEAVEASGDQCKPGWVSFENSCFRMDYNDEKSFGDAERACVEIGGNKSHLASCLSDGELRFLENYFNRFIYDYTWFWIGGMFINTSIFDREGSTLSNLDGTDFKPKLDDVATASTGGNLVLIGNKRGYLYSTSGKLLRYICKSGPTSCGPEYECPPGWFRDFDKCYTYDFEKKVNLSDAVTDCKSKGGQLAEISSDYEWEMLKQQLDFLDEYEYQKFWLGAFNPSTVDVSSTLWCDKSSPVNAQEAIFGFDKFGDESLCLDICEDCENQQAGYVCQTNISKVKSQKKC